eukprot:719974-Amphidinium_carterae.2
MSSHPLDDEMKVQLLHAQPQDWDGWNGQGWRNHGTNLPSRITNNFIAMTDKLSAETGVIRVKPNHRSVLTTRTSSPDAQTATGKNCARMRTAFKATLRIR